MAAQQDAVRGRERDVLAAEILWLARRVWREASRGECDDGGRHEDAACAIKYNADR